MTIKYNDRRIKIPTSIIKNSIFIYAIKRKTGNEINKKQMRFFYKKLKKLKKENLNMTILKVEINNEQTIEFIL